MNPKRKLRVATLFSILALNLNKNADSAFPKKINYKGNNIFFTDFLTIHLYIQKSKHSYIDLLTL